VKVKPIGTADGVPQQFHFFCPGCKHGHAFNATWTYNGDGDKPTVSPSIKVTGGADPAYCCHSFIRDGRIEFLSDCSHDLAGQTVDLPDLESEGA
jgi:hypothetical protein